MDGARVARAEAAVARAEALALQGLAYVPMYVAAQETLRTAMGRLQSLEAGDPELSKQLQALLVQFRLCTPRTITASVKDEVLGAEIMARSDYNDGMERQITARFSKVDVRCQVKNLMTYLRPWKELARRGKRRMKKLKASEMADEEKTLQLGVNYILQSLEGTCCFFHDTSTGGIVGSNDKPDCLYSVVKPLVSWLTAVLVGELKWDLGDTVDRTRCVGQIVSRLRKIIETQQGRKLAFGFIADRSVIQFVGLDVSSGTETFWWSRDFPFEKGAKDWTGFTLLLKMIYADANVHGYVPTATLQDLALEHGRFVRNMHMFKFRGERASSSNDWACYSGLLDVQDVVVKVCPTLKTELRVLHMLQGTPGILPVLGDGVLDGRRYMVIPMCKPLGPFSIEYRLLLLQIAETIKLLSDQNTFHADISVGNIVCDESRHYLIDFGSAVTGAVPDEDDERTGCTLVFAAIQVHEGNRHCLSSELESLMYVLVYLAMDGSVPWKYARGNKEMASFKRVVLSDEASFTDRVLGGVRQPSLHNPLLHLRKLFFAPKYQCDVTYEAFCCAVNMSFNETSSYACE